MRTLSAGENQVVIFADADDVIPFGNVDKIVVIIVFSEGDDDISIHSFIIFAHEVMKCKANNHHVCSSLEKKEC